MGCLRSLGTKIEVRGESTVIEGGTWKAPTGVLDAGNSGTSMRLLSGLLAGQPFESVLDGDESLRKRPMKRVTEPLCSMGATIESSDGHAPLRIRGGNLHGIRYQLPVPSAQVKSCVLLAGLFASGTTTILEPIPSRDHTERILAATGVDIQVEGNGVREISVSGKRLPSSFELDIPGDLSSAAFLFTAAAILDTSVEVRRVGINPSRTGFLDVLGRMGCDIRIENEHISGGEPVADVRVSGAAHRPITVQAEDVPRLVDEIPLVALLATAAEGLSVVRGASELRVKESDRISTLVAQLGRLGATIEEHPDGFSVQGPQRLAGASCSSKGDHRMAMLLAIAALRASGTTTIEGAEAADVSFPGFAQTIFKLGGSIEET